MVFIFRRKNVIISHLYLKSSEELQLLSPTPEQGRHPLWPSSPLSLWLAPSWNPLHWCAGPVAMPRWTAHDLQCWHPLFLLPRHPCFSFFLFFQGPAQTPLQVSCHKCNNCPVSTYFLLHASRSLNLFLCIMVNCVGVGLVTELEVMASRGSHLASFHS